MLTTLALALSMVAGVVPATGSTAMLAGAGIDVAPLAASPSGRYVVLLADAPLVRYQGGIAGLAPTAPAGRNAKLDSQSPASRAYLSYLDGRQATVRAAIATALARPIDVPFTYTAVLSGFAVELTAGEAARVARLPGVRAVVPDAVRQLLTDNGPAWIGADGIWDGTESGSVATKGEGVVVGIIDSGVNHDHPSFADIGGDGYDHTNPTGTFHGMCDPVSGLPFCNDKLIGVYDFFGTTPEDDSGHGSHTASTVAGNVLDAELVAPTVTIQRPISGVAPHANLITYKVCSGTTAIAVECLVTSSVAAINTAVLDGVDVINYSVGGASSDPWVDLDAQAYLDARAAGIFVATSAGNEGPGAGTIGSPADAPWVLTVGAATHDRALDNSLVDMAGGAASAPADILGTSLTAGLPSTPIVYAGDYGYPLCGDGPAIDATGEATINPFTPGTFNGEIVVCDRGTYGRVEKGQNVMEGGAGGFVLANDAANGDSLIGDAYPLPGLHITYDDGVVLKAWLAGGAGHVAAITGTQLNESPENGDQTASFSSRGPNPASGDILKPDVTGPGVDILAAFNTPFTDPLGPTEYGVISGTSMSSPHAAGSAALIVALHPDWTPAELQSALMTTGFTDMPGDGTEVHGVLKEDGVTAADPFDMGAGRLNLHAAGRAGLVLDETADDYIAADPATGGDPSALNLPSLAQDACNGTCSWHREVRSTAAVPVTWQVNAASDVGMALSVSPASFTLAPGESVVLSVAADTTAATPEVWRFGRISLAPSVSSVPAAHLPLAVFPTATFPAPVLEDPGDVNTTGDYTLAWSDLVDDAGYRVEQSADLELVFNDDAEAGMADKWSTEPIPDGWSESPLQANSGAQSYWSGQSDERTSTLTLASPISVPAGAEAVVQFASYEDTEPDFDYGYVEGSSDGGASWETFAVINGFSDGWIQRSVVLGGLSGNVLVRFRYVTDQLVSLPLYTGWFVDDIGISLGHWTLVGATGADQASLAINDQPNGIYHHRVAGLFDPGGANLVRGPWSNVVDITVDKPLPDLRVTAITAANRTGSGAGNGKPKAGDKVDLIATVSNLGEAPAPTSQTAYALDGQPMAGSPKATPAVPAGGSVQVTLTWDTRGIQGEHVIAVTADVGGVIVESHEMNNISTLTVTVRGNKVQNESFEGPNEDASGPADWSGTDTAAGTTTWSEGGSEGERSASIKGTGGNVVLSGMPTWTSDPIDVTGGELLDLRVNVLVDRTSSAPAAGLAYLGPAGELINTVRLITLPRLTDGFDLFERSVTIPAGVAEVRVVLFGFAPTDLRTAGTVTFDDVGLYEE